MKIWSGPVHVKKMSTANTCRSMVEVPFGISGLMNTLLAVNNWSYRLWIVLNNESKIFSARWCTGGIWATIYGLKISLSKRVLVESSWWIFVSGYCLVQCLGWRSGANCKSLDQIPWAMLVTWKSKYDTVLVRTLKTKMKSQWRYEHDTQFT